MHIESVDNQRIAILYQALPPPVIDGLRKDAKPGGYSDGGADIGYALRGAGFDVVTPIKQPAPAAALDWVFPDTQAGIALALSRGATMLWANTVLFEGHPHEQVLDRVWIVGQRPVAMERADNKFATNARLLAHGLPVAQSILASRTPSSGVHAFAALDAATLQAVGLSFPLVVKPVRGRGSQGITVVRDIASLLHDAEALGSSGRFGETIVIEQFLPCQELTVAVLPARTPGGARTAPWPLPAVRRFDHIDGIVPYNGDVPVSLNSEVLDADGCGEYAALMAACVRAAEILDVKSVIRIDCRQDSTGTYRLFDLNMKPNLTGAGRPGRDAEDCLCALAARAIGWTYPDLLRAMAMTAWRDE